MADDDKKRLKRYALDEKALLRLKAKAELAKINLSDSNSTQVEFVGKLSGKLCQIDFRLTRKEYCS